MKSKKGFVLTETLVVTVFLVTISTFVYVSIVPLMGRYDDLIERERDIDIVYKLYNIRKLIYNDSNKEPMTTCLNNNGETVTPCAKVITCNNFGNRRDYCNNLISQLELSDYRLVYVNNIYKNLDFEHEKVIITDTSTDFDTTEIFNYIKTYQDDEGEYLILLDLTPDKYTNSPKHTIVHLLFAPFIQTY